MKILLVEDNPGDARLIEAYLNELEGRPYSLIQSPSLKQALNLLNSESIDMVLLDLSLPDSTGIQTFLKLAKQARQLPVIVLTGLQDEALASRALREGAQDYLLKNELSSSLLQRAIRYAVDRKHAEEELKNSLREKELLLKEVHHRVKNNMQVISSLLRLQSRHIHDSQAMEMFVESQARVRSMALVHESIYKSDNLGQIDFSQYIDPLARGLYRLYEADPLRIQLQLDVEVVLLSVDQAIPCGLIVNELLTNALKYGFPESESGPAWIRIELKMKKKSIFLCVEDNGKGIPETFNIQETDSLGLQLVRMLVEDQLRGAFQLDQTCTTRFMIEFLPE